MTIGSHVHRLDSGWTGWEDRSSTVPPELLQWVGSLQVGRLHLKDMYRVKQICKECKNADICKILIDIVRLVRSLPCIALTSAQHVPPHQLLLPTEAAVPA